MKNTRLDFPLNTLLLRMINWLLPIKWNQCKQNPF